jgi:hypothetical protein
MTKDLAPIEGEAPAEPLWVRFLQLCGSTGGLPSQFSHFPEAVKKLD